MTSKRICLWSSPRNLSTALMYSFAQRPDTVVFDEPLYAHYLRVSNAEHPGKEDILEAQDNDGTKVIQDVLHKDYGKLVVFFKQMTHHLVDVNFDFLTQVSNIIYIRDPKQIIASYAQVIKDVKMEDVGIEKQAWLYHFLTEKQHPVIVLNSAEILKNPEQVLSNLCKALDIPFYKEMLSWPAGAKTYDGVWAKHWYKNVHQSTHFAQQETSSRDLPDYLVPLYEECKQYYDLLNQYSIKV